MYVCTRVCTVPKASQRSQIQKAQKTTREIIPLAFTLRVVLLIPADRWNNTFCWATQKSATEVNEVTSLEFGQEVASHFGSDDTSSASVRHYGVAVSDSERVAHKSCGLTLFITQRESELAFLDVFLALERNTYVAPKYD